MGDAASRTGWGVVLAGHSFDLEYWREALKQRFDPLDPWVTDEVRTDPPLKPARQRGHAERGLRARQGAHG